MNLLFSRTSVADYDKANEEASRRIVARYSRGNVRVQDGRYLTTEDLRDLTARGDEAARKLRAMLAERANK